MRLRSVLLAIMAGSLGASSAIAQSVLYVDDTATGADNGSSWCDAFVYLQDAIAAAEASGGTVAELHVAQGTYKPDQGASQGAGDRAATFGLLSGLALMGGYAGCGAADPDERDITSYETILSGDLNGDDGPDFANTSENSYHVVSGYVVDNTAVLDGFTITAGHADGVDFPYNDEGGGIYNHRGDLTVSNCTFSHNLAAWGGGGMYNDHGDPTVSDCTFSHNLAAEDGGGIYNEWSYPTVTASRFIGNVAESGNGGGMFVHRGGSSTIRDCVFDSNVAYWMGGGIAADASVDGWNPHPMLDRCVLTGNQAGFGGGAAGFDSTLTLTNCTLMGNSATTSKGGAIYMTSWWNAEGQIVLRNCTLSGNNAVTDGGAVYASSDNTTVSVVSCVLWGNTDSGGADESAQIYLYDGAVVTVDYSCIQGLTGGFGGSGNTGADPLFVDAAAGDLHLQAGSPCINGGDLAFTPEPGEKDIDLEDRVQQCRVDIGADETEHWFADCNENGTSDACDIAEGTSPDCDSEGTPDECQPDCDDDGTPDPCEFPPIGTSEDCNQNAVPDECDVALGTSEDCNGDGVPDECQVDCNENGVPDDCDITSETSNDCDGNGVPDECQQDCDNNGLTDICEVLAGTSPDEDANGLLDICEPPAIHVDSNAAGLDNGIGWPDAFNDLQDALDRAAQAGGNVTELWVAGGTYTPDRGTGDRDATFQLLSDLAVYGGFAGNELKRWQRDPGLHVTILSGEIGGPDETDNSYRIVTASATNRSARLDGFVITGGRGSSGAGFYADGGDLKVVNCQFRDNAAWQSGGAVVIVNSNTALIDCVFTRNTAERNGGAIAIGGGAPFLINCLFSGNLVGLHEDLDAYGGALSVSGSGDVTLINCTLVGNQAVPCHGAGGGVLVNSNSSATLKNCVLWNNLDSRMGYDAIGNPQINFYAGSTIDVTYSVIMDDNPNDAQVFPGVGNTDDDPTFVDAGYWTDVDPPAPGVLTWVEGDYRPLFGSPLIDSGDNGALTAGISTDLDGMPRRFDSVLTPDTGSGTPPIVDMGAYEFQDCNVNGVLDILDIAVGTSLDCNANDVPDECDPDCDGDGTPDDCQTTCTDNCVCDDGDPCTADACVEGACEYTAATYGDVNFSGIVNVFDIFCILDGIAGDFSECAFGDLDLEPCGGNGTLNVFDVFAALNAIAGIDLCCGGSP